ncbi:hypothetical protein MMPV_003322 [Pyropia vietnamensis]
MVTAAAPLATEMAAGAATAAPLSTPLAAADCAAVAVEYVGTGTAVAAVAAAAAVPPTLHVTLNPDEALVCALLADTAERLSQQSGKVGGEGVTVRIVGGWVRNKLLGGEVEEWGWRGRGGGGDGADGGGVDGCGGVGWLHGGVSSLSPATARHRPLDIDTAVCGISSWDFALSLHAAAAVVTPPPHPPPRGHAHSTVTLKVGRIYVDVTGVRGKGQGEPGAPPLPPAARAAALDTADAREAAWVADATARDLTLNALLVDPSNRAVADPTRRGVAAVAARLAATPAAATVTLGADPRRALRVARFAAVARLTIDDAIPPAAAAVAAPALATAVAGGGGEAAAVAHEVDALVTLGGGAGSSVGHPVGSMGGGAGGEDGGVVVEDGEGEGKDRRVPPWVAGCAAALDAYEGWGGIAAMGGGRPAADDDVDVSAKAAGGWRGLDRLGRYVALTAPLVTALQERPVVVDSPGGGGGGSGDEGAAGQVAAKTAVAAVVAFLHSRLGVSARHAAAVAASHGAAAEVAAAVKSTSAASSTVGVGGAATPVQLDGDRTSGGAPGADDPVLPVGTSAHARRRVMLGRLVRRGGPTWRLGLVAAALHGRRWVVVPPAAAPGNHIRSGDTGKGDAAVAAAASADDDGDNEHNSDDGDDDGNGSGTATSVAAISSVGVAAAARLAAEIDAAGLATAWAARPALAGSRIDAALPRRRKGDAAVQTSVADWAAATGGTGGRDACTAWLRAVFPDYA